MSYLLIFIRNLFNRVNLKSVILFSFLLRLSSDRNVEQFAIIENRQRINLVEELTRSYVFLIEKAWPDFQVYLL